MWPYYAALGVGVLLGVGGQVLLKSGAGHEGDTVLQQLLRPHTIIGLALYGMAAFTYIIALRKLPVSVAFLSVSLSYVLVAVLGHVMFNEAFGTSKIAGLLLIMGGVWLVNQG